MDATIHKSYTAGFKLTVVAKAEEIGNRGAAREFNVDEKCIRRWRTDKEDLKKMPVSKRAQRGGGVAWPDLERELESWLKSHESKTVSVSEIQAAAKFMAEQMGLTNFRGNLNWCYRFMKRKQLSANTKSGKQSYGKEQKEFKNENSYINCIDIDFKLTVVARAKKVGNKAAALEFDVCECCIQKWRLDKDLKMENVKQNFQKYCSEEKSSFLKRITLTALKKKLTTAQIINVDEIPFSFHFVNSEENKIIPILTTGSEKLSFTCVISCASNGDRLKPFVIFKQKSIPSENYSANVIVRTSEEGVLCKNLGLEWLYEVWRKRKGAIFDPRGILIVDSMQRQLFESVESKYEEMSAMLAVIPNGLTKLLHPLSFLIRKTFENEMIKHYEKWINNGLHSFTEENEIKEATPEEIVEWVSESWKSVKVSTITYGFLQAGIVLPKDNVNLMSAEKFEEIEDGCNSSYLEVENNDVNAYVNGYEEIIMEDVKKETLSDDEVVLQTDGENLGNTENFEEIENGYMSSYVEVMKNNANTCDNDYSEIIKVNNCEEIRKKRKNRSQMDVEKGTLSDDEVLKLLFTSDSDESEFEGF